VSRFVIDGFSGGDTRADLYGSDGGAACPLPLRFSVGTAIPFCLTGFDSGEPVMDEACDLSVTRESLGALTVAMTFEGAALGTEEMCGMEEVAAKAVRARPLLWLKGRSQNEFAIMN
jgi:hypothetical protein